MYTEALRTIFLEAILPEILKGIFGKLLLIPFLGNGISWVATKVVAELIKRGIVILKVEIIDQLSQEAKENYAPMIAIIREAQSKPELSDEEEAEYEKRLKEVVRNRPGIVNG